MDLPMMIEAAFRRKPESTGTAQNAIKTALTGEKEGKAAICCPKCNASNFVHVLERATVTTGLSNTTFKGKPALKKDYSDRSIDNISDCWVECRECGYRMNDDMAVIP